MLKVQDLSPKGCWQYPNTDISVLRRLKTVYSSKLTETPKGILMGE